MKQLRKTIRKILLESNNKLTKLAKLLLSNNLESVNQALELGEMLGLFTLEKTFDRDAYRSLWSTRFGRMGQRERVFCLDVKSPEMHEALVNSNSRDLQPMRMSEFAAGYEGGIWIICEIEK